MIKSSEEIVMNVLIEHVALGDKEEAKKIIRDYALSIVAECASNFECTMEQDYRTVNEIDEVPDGKPYPVLVRASIQVVKEMIK